MKPVGEFLEVGKSQTLTRAQLGLGAKFCEQLAVGLSVQVAEGFFRQFLAVRKASG
jgi:hypothetical protein